MILILLLHALWGAAIPISKILLHYTSPLFLSGIRMFLGGILLIGYNIAYKKIKFSFTKEQIILLIQALIYGVYLKYNLRYWTLSQMSSIKMAFILTISPFITALMSYFFYKERLTYKKITGLLIGFLGVIPILITSSASEQISGEFFYISWPECALFAAMISNCYAMIAMRTLIRTHHFSPSVINGIIMIGGGALSLVTAFCVYGFTWPITNTGAFCGWLIALIIISNIICKNVYISLLKKYSITFISFTDFLNPIFSAVYAYFFLGEVLTWHYYISGICILFGLYIFYQEELKNPA